MVAANTIHVAYFIAERELIQLRARADRDAWTVALVMDDRVLGCDATHAALEANLAEREKDGAA